MKNRIVTILLVLALSFVMVACSQTSDVRYNENDNITTVSPENDITELPENDIKEDVELTMKEKLISGNWYYNGIETGFGKLFFVKYKFFEDGTCETVVMMKDSNEQGSSHKWRYDEVQRELIFYMDGGSEYSVKCYFDESNCWFQYDYDEYYWINKDMPEEFAELYKDGMNVHIFQYDETFESLDIDAFNSLCSVVYGENDYSYLYNMGY